MCTGAFYNTEHGASKAREEGNMCVFKIFTLGVVLLALAVGASKRAGLAQADCSIMVKPGESIQQAIDGTSSDAAICSTAGELQENLTITRIYRCKVLRRHEVILNSINEGKPVILIESDRVIEDVVERLTMAKAIVLTLSKLGATMKILRQA